jgi:uncharacterized protein YdeI (YjbR/CyaY-like superfamily)
MPKQFQFDSRFDFRVWLEDNCLSDEGVWLVFGKAGGPKTITAGEALEEALCFGWIDGQIKSVDDRTYLKYFAQRRKNTEWSAKNIKTAEQLEAAGRMTDYGRAKINEARQNHRFEAKKRLDITDDHIAQLINEITEYEPAYSNFLKMSQSVKRTYTAFYFDAKSETARANKLGKIIERLNNNLKPM